MNCHPDVKFSAGPVRDLEDHRAGEEIQGEAGYLHHVLVAWSNNLRAKSGLGDVTDVMRHS